MLGVYIRNVMGIGVVFSFFVRGFGGGSLGYFNMVMVLVNGIFIYVAFYVDISIFIFFVIF